MLSTSINDSSGLFTSSATYSVLNSMANAQKLIGESLQRVSTGDRLTIPEADIDAYLAVEKSRISIMKRNSHVKELQKQLSIQQQQSDLRDKAKDTLLNMNKIVTQAHDSSLAREVLPLKIEYSMMVEQLRSQSQDTTFNGLYTAGADQIVIYDPDEEKFTFCNTNGDSAFQINHRIAETHVDLGNQPFKFDPTTHYMVSRDGANIYFCNTDGHMVTHSIAEGLIQVDQSMVWDSPHFVVDENDSLYFSVEKNPGSGIYTIKKQSIEKWSVDPNFDGIEDKIQNMASSAFTVYDGNVYYIDTDLRVIEQGILDNSSRQMIYDSNDLKDPLNLVSGQFAISSDGVFIADALGNKTIRIIDTLRKIEFKAFSHVDNVADLTFDTSSSSIVYRDADTNQIFRIKIHHDPVKDNYTTENPEEILSRRSSQGFSKVVATSARQPTSFIVHYTERLEEFTALKSLVLRPYDLGIARIRLPEWTDKNANYYIEN